MNTATITLTPPPLRLEPVKRVKSFPPLDQVRWVPGDVVLIVPVGGGRWHACQSCHERPTGRVTVYQSSTDASVTSGPVSHSWLLPPSRAPETVREAPAGTGNPSRVVATDVVAGELVEAAAHPDNATTQATRIGAMPDALRCRI